MTISDALVEKAARAAHETVSHLPWEMLEPGEKMHTIATARAALEAAAPSLRAEGVMVAFETACFMASQINGTERKAEWQAVLDVSDAILARAAEIEGGRG